MSHKPFFKLAIEITLTVVQAWSVLSLLGLAAWLLLALSS